MRRTNGTALKQPNTTPLAPPLPARFKKANRIPRSGKEVKLFREPDEVLVKLRTIIDDYSANFPSWSVKRIAADIATTAKLNQKTILNIISGDTSRPQNHTCDQIFKACGWERHLLKIAS